ncbi:hypothetical protein R1flu_008137 [Riccia fluitans]|uniref:Uncharacterized protein n=1 Tax=Riccia fluitans TaxID=41844 RepID=A0ABD1YAV9_9MARC
MRSTHSAARAKKLKVMATPSTEVQEPQSGRQRKEKSSIRAAGSSFRHRMNRDEYKLIIGYLEDPIQLAEILGSSRKTKIGARNPSKLTAFGVMAVHLMSKDFPSYNSSNMQKKFNRYVASFWKVKEWSKSTGAGLKEEELERGMTIEVKLNKKCPFYFQMHVLFGHCVNIEPSALADGGLPNDKGDELTDGGLLDNEGDEEDVYIPMSLLDLQVTQSGRVDDDYVRNSADDGPFHSDVIPGINAKTTSPVDLSEEEYEDDLIVDRDGDDVEIHLPAEDDIHMDAGMQPFVNP